MGARVLGIGLGLFLLSILWSLAILISVLTGRAKYPYSILGALSILTASLITFITLIIPRSGRNNERVSHILKQGKLPTDPIYIWRIVILAANIIATLIGFIFIHIKWISKKLTRLRVLKVNGIKKKQKKQEKKDKNEYKNKTDLQTLPNLTIIN